MPQNQNLHWLNPGSRIASPCARVVERRRWRRCWKMLRCAAVDVREAWNTVRVVVV
ncbi:hypothetical protein MA5S0422_1406 [Mycobacteroides abscessus 5S-0422]|uniref:Uncharacterized protein n=1 Tax=Mycobacteroides abscessus subsp. bolletii 1513 TaxID=1299321 RepID=X8DRI5_9MYCO|nr:hypothetical protein MA5S0304_0418 [Mycobacteroides abscessus 5S-0304]EIU18524.1 hypothetical protein MA5S0422_1406 [Mycobacteroides abscessus 5S-0422]EIU33229.1 hypothetical protein MA5S0817_0451 [Mycobacteroides abscessus 5S-0817]EIU35083.1 hypothetical protein MA5S1212_0842 [Mycobacteroides abscessus 5S-1212]EIU42281.1 hypothetical protein MA5S1215_1652 [Mycobacteroides abscessus 5S-1215]EUA70120.1 hypothetical protein I540_1399 [Mycobacteroides abscessus subsp. bolletii 1513]